eukprot:scaffold10307_cov120-Isochrysis_galbana.AAC.4
MPAEREGVRGAGQRHGAAPHLEDLLHATGDVVMLLADDAGVKDARGRVERVDGGVDALLGDTAGENRGGIQVGEGCGGRRIGQVISRHSSHVGGEGGLVADGRRNTAEQGRHLGARLEEGARRERCGSVRILGTGEAQHGSEEHPAGASYKVGPRALPTGAERAQRIALLTIVIEGRWLTMRGCGRSGAHLGEAENVVHKEKHVLPLGVTEVLGHRERGERDAGAGAGRLVHLSVDECRLGAALQLDHARVHHLVVQIVALASALANTAEDGEATVRLKEGVGL